MVTLWHFCRQRHVCRSEHLRLLIFIPKGLSANPLLQQCVRKLPPDRCIWLCNVYVFTEKSWAAISHRCLSQHRVPAKPGWGEKWEGGLICNLFTDLQPSVDGPWLRWYRVLQTVRWKKSRMTDILAFLNISPKWAIEHKYFILTTENWELNP